MEMRTSVRAKSWLDQYLRCESLVCQGTIDGLLRDDDFDKLRVMMQPQLGLRQLAAMIKYLERRVGRYRT